MRPTKGEHLLISSLHGLCGDISIVGIRMVADDGASGLERRSPQHARGSACLCSPSSSGLPQNGSSGGALPTSGLCGLRCESGSLHHATTVIAVTRNAVNLGQLLLGISNGLAHALERVHDVVRSRVRSCGARLESLCSLGDVRIHLTLASGHRALSLTEGSRVAGSAPVALELVVQILDCKRDALHVKRGDILAHKRLYQRIALLLKKLPDSAPHHEELLVLSRAKSVENNGYALRVIGGSLGKHSVDEDLRDLGGRLEVVLPHARLSVYALTNFHLSFRHVEEWRCLSRKRAATEAHGHGTGTLVGLLGNPDELVERDPGGRGCASCLEHHEGANVTAALLLLLRLCGGYVVGDVESATIDALLYQTVTRHVEVHLVARIIAANDKDTVPVVDGMRNAEHVLRRR